MRRRDLLILARRGRGGGAKIGVVRKPGIQSGVLNADPGKDGSPIVAKLRRHLGRMTKMGTPMRADSLDGTDPAGG